MTEEEKRDYARRINEANPSELIVVLYDMLKGDLFNAKYIMQEMPENIGAAESELHHAQLVISHLREDLDFSEETKEISGQLFSLYDYVLRRISKAIYSRDIAAVDEAISIITALSESFEAVAAQDTRGSMTKNAETTYAGLTYGRSGINETTGNYDSNRGFLA